VHTDPVGPVVRVLIHDLALIRDAERLKMAARVGVRP
jgi:hypothetical protein